MKYIIQTIICLSMLIQPAFADTSLTGKVTDLATGYIIPNVAIKCSNGDITHTNNQGIYFFNDLGIGVFSFTFSKNGYATIEKTRIEVGTGQVLNVIMAPPCILNILTENLPPASKGISYNSIVDVNCHTEPFTFFLISGKLPDGLSLNESTGNIYGIPTQEGSYSFQIGVTDALDNSAEMAFTIVVTEELLFKTDANLPYATQWQPYSFSFEVVNGSLPYIFLLESGYMPKGIFLSQTGQIGGGSTIVESFDKGLPFYWATGGEIIPTITENKRLAFANLVQGQQSILQLEAHTTENASIGFNYEIKASTDDVFIFFIDRVEMKRFNETQSNGFTLDGLSDGIHHFQWSFQKKSSSSDFSCAWLDDIQIDGIEAVPTETGNSDMAIRVTDSEGRTCLKNFHMQILPPLRIDDMILINGIIGKNYSQQFSASGGELPLTWQIYYGHPPEGITLDASSGQLHGVPLETTYGTLVFAVTDAVQRLAYMDATLQIVAPLEIVSTSLPEGLVDEQYSESIVTKGGLYPLNFSLAGKLPEGLSLDTETGIIHGKALRTGLFSMEITVFDQNLPVPQSSKQALQIRIQNGLTILSSSVLPRSKKSVEITPIILKAAGGKQPYIWSIISGALPNGIELNVTTGIITGVPVDKGDATFDIQVTDSEGTTAQKKFLWFIADNLSISTGALADAVKDEHYEQVIKGKGGYPPYYWRIKSGALLTGLTFNSVTGVIYGRPTRENEIRSFTVEITDSDTPAQKACQTFTIQVLPQELYIITAELPLARINQAYQHLIRAALGIQPYQWRVKNGLLPQGIQLIDDPQTARIEGKPIETGEFYFDVEVADTSLPPNHALKTFKLVVQGGVEISNESLKDACSNQYYSDRIVAINGTLPYSFQITDGNLPDNIQLNINSGAITGIPTLTPGNHATFTVRVTDSGNPSASDEKSFFIYGRHCPLTIDPKSMPQASAMMTYELALIGKGGISPYRFYLDSEQLPPGLELSSNGSIKGIPEAQGTFSFVIRMEDAAGSLAQQAYTMEVVPCESCPIISGKSLHASGAVVDGIKIVFHDAEGYTRIVLPDDNGTYQTRVPIGWSGTVIPKKIGYTFEPQNRVYQEIMNNQIQQNFIASVLLFTISGKIINPDTDEVASNVSVQYGDAGSKCQTNDLGIFQFEVPYGWSGTIMPVNQGYRFEPQAIVLKDMKHDQKDVNFSANPTYKPQIDVSPLSIILKNSATRLIVNDNTSKQIRSNNGLRSYETGLIIPEHIKKYWQTHFPDDRYRKRKNLPDKIDWSTYDSPVRDQRACGSCWAFAGVAMLENLANQVALMPSIDLSEQILVSCVYKDRSNGGCYGGWYWDVFDFTKKNGIPPENCFPYIAKDGRCENQCDEPEYTLKLSNFTPESGLWGEEFSVQDIKGALQDGPLSVAFYVPDSFYNYSGGIFDYKSGTYDFGHAVLLVGYDDDNQCFKVKNSWGKSWGEDGYFRIAYNDAEDDIKFGCYACAASGVYIDRMGGVITIQNTGTGALTIHQLSTDKNWLSFEPQNIDEVMPDQMAQINVFIKDWSLIESIDETAVLTIHSSDTKNNVIQVQIQASMQAQSSQPVLSVSPPFQSGVWIENNIIHVTVADSDMVEFRVSNTGNGEMQWFTETEENWLNVTKGTNGTNDGIVQITCISNTDILERMGEISIIADSALNSPQIIQIHQQGLSYIDANGNQIVDVGDIIQMLKNLAGMKPLNMSSMIDMKDVIMALNRIGNNK